MHPESCVKGSNNVFIVNRALRASSYDPHMCVVSPEWRKGLPGAGAWDRLQHQQAVLGMP